MASHDNILEDELDPNWVCCLLEDIPVACGDSLSLDSEITWPAPLSGSLPCSRSPCARNQDCSDETCRKRVRCGSSNGPSSKACREKMRRDRVNERFLELSSVLEPGTTTLKCDKNAILTDAIRMVNMLHEETNRLKDPNLKLKEKISGLKSEKNELRAEKLRLKADKEDIERRIKGFGAHHPSFQFQPSYPIPYQPIGPKILPFVNNPGVSFVAFCASKCIDTSQDHVLHPPVA